MKAQNLIMGGLSLDDEELEQIRDLDCKLQDAMQDVVLKLIELRKDVPMSKEAAMAVALHDFEFILEDEMCEAEDLIREEVPENKLTDFAILCETLKASHAGYWESVKKHLNK